MSEDDDGVTKPAAATKNRKEWNATSNIVTLMTSTTSSYFFLFF